MMRVDIITNRSDYPLSRIPMDDDEVTELVGWLEDAEGPRVYSLDVDGLTVYLVRDHVVAVEVDNVG